MKQYGVGRVILMKEIWDWTAALLFCIVFSVVIRLKEKEVGNIAYNAYIGFQGNSGYTESINLKIAGIINFMNAYCTLNRDIFGEDMLFRFNDETKQEIEDYAESVKGDLTEVWEADSIVPQGLIIELENMIYQSINSSIYEKIRV